MTVKDTKALARKTAFARREQADVRSNTEANRHLGLAVRSAEGRTVSGYWPMRTEIDPRPTLDALANTHVLCLPVVIGSGRALEFRRWSPGVAMSAGAFGTHWPAEDDRVTPEILIVPLAAFDRRGYRLGYGGGFYDRTLERLRANGPVTAIGFAYSIQEAKEVPTEATDQPLDMIVTENGILHAT